MKNLFIIVALIIIAASCSDRQRLILKKEWFDINKGKIKKEYFELNNRSQVVLQGPYKEFYLNGKISLEGNYLQNLKHGKFIKYNEQGIKITEQLFKFNRLDSVSMDFYPNGKIKLLCTYLNDTLDGKMIEYFENGDTCKSINIKKGKKDGETRFFFESGNLQAILNYKNGKLDGSATGYDSLGNLIKRKYFKDGEEVPYPKNFVLKK